MHLRHSQKPASKNFETRRIDIHLTIFRDHVAWLKSYPFREKILTIAHAAPVEYNGVVGTAAGYIVADCNPLVAASLVLRRVEPRASLQYIVDIPRCMAECFLQLTCSFVSGSRNTMLKRL